MANINKGYLPILIKDIDLFFFAGLTVLHVAILKGSKKLIGTILDMGADINQQVSIISYLFAKTEWRKKISENAFQNKPVLTQGLGSKRKGMYYSSQGDFFCFIPLSFRAR